MHNCIPGWLAWLRPRTISGKIVELAVRNVVHNRPVKNTDALANPEALHRFRNLAELQC